MDVLRGAVIALSAALAARALFSIATHRLVLVALVMWVAVPILAVAYVWASLPNAVLHQPLFMSCLHLALAAVRLAPIALLIAVCVPSPPLDAAALHCLRLTAPHGMSGWTLRWQWWKAGPGRRWLVACVLMFPLALGEFELGSRLNVGTWAVRLFDAQAGGQFLATTLLQAAPGVLVQLAAVVLAWVLVQGAAAPGTPASTPASAAWVRISAWILLACGSLALVVLPLATLVIQVVSGLSVVLAQAGNLRSEIGASLIFAAVAAACAWLLAGLLSMRRGGPITLRLISATSLIPGLCGSLVVGLVMLALVHLPPLVPLANTPLPLVAALVTLVLPYAVALRWLNQEFRSGVAWHQAVLLDAGTTAQRLAGWHLRWQLAGRHQWWMVSLLFLWLYCDLAASAILHPVDMTPALVRLYNLMHYGESTALSVQLTMTLIAPLALLSLAYSALCLLRWSRLCWLGRNRAS